MLHVLQISIPIPDYYQEEVFHQRFLFESSPSKEQMEKFLEHEDKKHRQRMIEDETYLYFHTYRNCLRSVQQTDTWEQLIIPPKEGQLVSTCIQGILVYLRDGKTQKSYINFSVLPVYTWIDPVFAIQ